MAKSRLWYTVDRTSCRSKRRFLAIDFLVECQLSVTGFQGSESIKVQLWYSPKTFLTIILRGTLSHADFAHGRGIDLCLTAMFVVPLMYKYELSVQRRGDLECLSLPTGWHKCVRRLSLWTRCIFAEEYLLRISLFRNSKPLLDIFGINFEDNNHAWT